ncbi:hypothetical protein ACFYZ8_31835 [Streptomyces sp. NPDC001668]|uniref:hypothetical protein n=1 Tax=unclassified Streptomyces TaxID=2593676 RepID=UPI0036C2C8E8
MQGLRQEDVGAVSAVGVAGALQLRRAVAGRRAATSRAPVSSRWRRGSRATLWRHSPAGTPAAKPIAVLFFWWSQRMLLGGRIAWSALVPGPEVSALGLLGLRVFSQLVFSRMSSSSAVR